MSEKAELPAINARPIPLCPKLRNIVREALKLTKEPKERKRTWHNANLWACQGCNTLELTVDHALNKICRRLVLSKAYHIMKRASKAP